MGILQALSLYDDLDKGPRRKEAPEYPRGGRNRVEPRPQRSKGEALRDPIVITSPHYNRYSAGNVDVTLLFREFERIASVEVRDFSLNAARRGDYDIIHVHWPEWLPRREKTPWLAALSAMWVLNSLAAAQKRGTKLVWDANNTMPHEPVFRELTDKFMMRFAAMSDLFVSCNASLGDEFIAKFPVLISKKRRLLGNRNYVGVYAHETESSENARRLLGLPTDEPIALAFGSARHYKNLPGMIDTFARYRQRTNRACTLLVAGGVTDSALEREIRQAGERDPRGIRLDLHFVPESDVALYFRAASLALIGTVQAVKSSVAGLALSLGTPVWVPRRGAAIDDADEIDEPMLNTYDGGITEAIIHRALDMSENVRHHIPPALRDGRIGESWSAYAQRMLDEYRSVLSSRNDGR